MARVRTVIKRASRGVKTKTFRFKGVVADFVKMEVTRYGENVHLTSKEFRMLEFMMKNPGRLLSRDELLNEVWGYRDYPCTRTVDNHILRLRQKLETKPAQPVHFLTMHGMGYKFVP